MAIVSAGTNLGALAAQRFIQSSSAQATKSAQELASGSRVSNPALDPSSAAVGYSLNARSQALIQANRNIIQAISEIQMAAGALGSTQEVLNRMKVLTTQGNSDTIGTKERNMINQEFQQLLSQVDSNASNARWGGVSLFTGAAGTPAAVGVVSEGVTGLTAVANAFANTLNAASGGMINGVASEATVAANGALYDVSIKVGAQTFKATVGAPTAAGTLTLVSTTDTGNSIVLNYDATAVTAITNAATFQTSLQTLLGVNTASKAVFSSLGTTAGGMANVTVSSGAATAAGTWALTYTGAAAGGTGTFKLTNGLEAYTASVTTSASMTGTVTFDNGTSLALATFDGTSNKAQELYTVTAGTTVTQNIQFGDMATDTLTLQFTSATVSGLGLSGLSVTTAANAQTASNKIDTAIQTVSTNIATLGGKLSQLNFMADTITVTVQNLTSAKQTFVDSDVTNAMTTMQQAKALGEISRTVFTDALSQQSEVARMVGQVR